MSDGAHHHDPNVGVGDDVQRSDEAPLRHPFCSARGSGTGRLDQGVAHTRVEIDSWYAFTPAETRRYWFFALTDFSGSYSARSSPGGAGDLLDAQATISLELNIYQREWMGWNRVTVLDLRADGIDDLSAELVDRKVHASVARLEANIDAQILARVRLEVFARGDTSYAELRFGPSDEGYVRAAGLDIR